LQGERFRPTGLASFSVAGSGGVLRLLAPALGRPRGSGLGEADARLITIRELDTGHFERAADRKFISNGAGSP